MHAVVRETHYAPGLPVHTTPEFLAFQQAHAGLSGYLGTAVVEAGEGRYLTVTLWRGAEDMHAARKVMGPVVEDTLNPLMSSPASLLATGPVVFTDLAQ